MAEGYEGAGRLSAQRLKALLDQPFNRTSWEIVCGLHLYIRIGNDAPATGRDAALDQLQRFRDRIDGVGCRYCDLWEQREAVYAETDIRFTDQHGTPRVIPCAIVARVMKGLLQDLRFHLDPSPIP